MEIRVVHVLIAVAVLLIISMALIFFEGSQSSNIPYWLLSVSALLNLTLAIILYSKNKKNK